MQDAKGGMQHSLVSSFSSQASRGLLRLRRHSRQVTRHAARLAVGGAVPCAVLASAAAAGAPDFGRWVGCWMGVGCMYVWQRGEQGVNRGRVNRRGEPVAAAARQFNQQQGSSSLGLRSCAIIWPSMHPACRQGVGLGHTFSSSSNRLVRVLSANTL